MDKKEKNGFWKRLHYELENMMMQGIVGRFTFLFTIIAVSILVFTFIMRLLNPDWSFGQALWTTYLRIIHPSMKSDDASHPWFYMLILFIMTAIGVMFSSSTISIITTSMHRRIDRLSKGETKVREQRPHVIILGYNDITKTIVKELAALYHHVGKRSAIVIMDNCVPASQMMEELNKSIKDYKVRVICRYGCISDMDDLDIVSMESCRSVMISAKDDFEAIETILACTGKLRQLENEGIDRSDVYINAVIRNKKNELEAQIAGGKRVKTICYDQVMSKIIAGSGREPGLSYVHQELMDYVRQGIFYYARHKLCGEGKISEDVDEFEMNRYMENSIVIGGVPEKDEEIPFEEEPNRYLFPSGERRKASEYRAFFVVKASDAQMKVLPPEKWNLIKIKEDQISSSQERHTPRIHDFLILGDYPMVQDILEEENTFFKALGQKAAVIIADQKDSVKRYEGAEMKEMYPALDISVQVANIDDYKTLKAMVEDTGVKSVIVLADPDADQRKADEMMLSRLVYLQKIRENYNSKNNDFNITCQIAMENTRKLADLTGANDFVVGNSMNAFIMTQIMLYPELYDVIHELLSGSSVAIYMRPVTDYLEFGNRGKIETDLYTLAEAASRRNEVFLGLHRLSFNKDTGEIYYNVPEINPSRWEEDGTTVKNYTVWAEDEAVVISIGV